MSAAGPKGELSAGMRMGLDFGPLILFFLVNWKFGIFAATGAFMAATAAAMLLSKIKTGAISPMLWFSGVMVIGFGSVTLWLHDDTFIKIKPTLYYGMIALILIFGLVTGRPTLKAVLGSAYPGLSERGWSILSRNWAAFFILMAIVNEAVWRNTSTDFWVGFKLWGALPATLIFAMANIPMLMRHGMADAIKDEPKAPPAG